MADWILLDSKEEEGIAVAFDSSEVTTKLTNRPSFTIGNGLHEEEFKDLHNCACVGGKLAYDLMWREGHVKTGVTARFELVKCQPNIRGRSAELMFAIAVLKSLYPKPDGYNDVAATGLLNQETLTVEAVIGVASKVRAGLKVLSKGAIIFVPKANAVEIGRDLYLQADNLGIDIIPITSLAEAARILDISIEKVYLDNPYLGLQAFRYEHNHIYFGREAAIQKLSKQLKERDEKGRPGALVIGSSGSGKSSLIQAGLMPSLTKGLNSLQDGRTFIWTLWTPSYAQGRDESALLQSLCNVWPINIPALPPVTSLSELGENIQKMLPANRRLLWVIDQMEELLTLGFDERVINVFGMFLQSLQQAGIWVVATLRSDFYKDYLNHEQLLTVFNDDGHFNLPPLDAGSLRLIIERPAELANVRFEVDGDGISLAERIHQDMDGTVEALPLLEFALQQLFDHMDDQRQMTFSAYKAIGGLKGAIGSYADAIYQNLTVDEQKALPKVLRALTTANGGNNLNFTAQPLDSNHFPPDSPEQSLIDKLVKYRLLIKESQHIENDVIRVAHEALLNYWQEAKAILVASTRDLEVRDQIAKQADRWKNANHHDDLLLTSGLPLEEGKQLLKRFYSELNEGIIAFIENSIRLETKRNSAKVRSQKRKLTAVTVTAIILGILFLLYWQRGKDLQTALSRSDLILAEELVTKGDFREALAYMAKAIRSNNDAKSATLAASLLSNNKVPVPETSFNKGKLFAEPVFTSKGVLGLIKDDKDNFQVWNISNNQPISPLMQYLATGGLSKDGNRVLAELDEYTLVMLDAKNGKPISAPMKHNEKIDSFFLNDDGKRVVASSASTVYLWDVDTCKIINKSKIKSVKDDEPKYEFYSIRFSGDELSFKGRPQISGNGAAALITRSDNFVEVITDKLITKPIQHQPLTDGSYNLRRISWDGSRIVTSPENKIVQVFDVTSFKPIGNPMVHEQPAKIVSFSQDGNIVVTKSNEQLWVWYVAEGERIKLKWPKQVVSSDKNISFSPDGRWLLFLDDSFLWLWNAYTDRYIKKSIPDAIAAWISPDDMKVITYSGDGTIRIWENLVHSEIEASNFSTAEYSKFSNDSSKVLNTSWDPCAWIIADSSTGENIKSNVCPIIDGHIPIQSFLSPDAKRVAINYNNGISIFSTESGGLVSKSTGNNSVMLKFSSDSRLTLELGMNSPIVRNLETGNIVTIDEKRVYYGYFSHNNQYVITATSESSREESVLKVWNINTGQIVSPPVIDFSDTFFIYSNYDYNPQLSSEGNRLAVVTKDKKTVQILNLETGKPVLKNLQHSYEVGVVAFSPDGQLLLTLSKRGGLIWNTETGELISAVDIDSNSLRPPHFSADSLRLIGVNKDAKIQVWDVITGMPISFPVDISDDAYITSLMFSPDGNKVLMATGGKGAMTRIYKLPKLATSDAVFSDFLESVAGYKLDDVGELHELPIKARDELKRDFAEQKFSDPEAKKVVDSILKTPN